MRHAVKGRKLGRTASHRKSTLNSLATALFRHKKIKTTVAKAKETRTFAEKLITKAKRNDVSARRHVARFIKDREVVKVLFNDIVEKVGDRPGGYTRVVKLGARKGDGADLAILELVDFNEGVAKAGKPKAETGSKKDKVKNAEVVSEAKDKAEDSSKVEDAEKPTHPEKKAETKEKTK